MVGQEESAVARRAAPEDRRTPVYVEQTAITGTTCSSREFQFETTRTKNCRR